MLGGKPRTAWMATLAGSVGLLIWMTLAASDPQATPDPFAATRAPHASSHANTALALAAEPQTPAPQLPGESTRESTRESTSSAATSPPLDVTRMTPYSVFAEALQRIEVLPYRERFATLSSFIDALHVAIVADGASPEQVRARRRDLLLGLGLLFDTQENLEDTPVTRHIFGGLLTEGEKKRRRDTCEMVLLNGRPDASKHFFLSAALTTVLGPVIAERLGRNKEIADARRRETTDSGQGFSFPDFAHDLAGIRYAVLLLEGDDASCAHPAPTLARCAPPVEPLRLPEELDWSHFQATYYGDGESRFRQLVAQIHAHFDAALHP